MCLPMAAGAQNPAELPEKHLRKQLAAAVRNIQWSYAIFWSISARQQGVLAWSDGYYNGDIKTRKTTQPTEFKADQMGLNRSEQLRELYESLSAGDSNQQSKRPFASLSPEDLTDTEWYYLVCMSFTFSPGQGLPGKALESNEDVWLSNAQFADCKIFSRSLLAKSASIQTVVCIPFMDGVLELGTTELVLEDPALIQQVTTSFWELPIPVCSEQSVSNPPLAEKDEDILCPNLEHEIVDTMILEEHNLVADDQLPLESGPTAFPFGSHSYASDKENELIQDKVKELQANICEEPNIDSPHDSSNECCPNQQANDSFIIEGLNGASQIHNGQLMDDEFSNGLHGSLNSSDCISQSFVNPQGVLSFPMGERIKNHVLDSLQDGDFTKLISLDLQGEKSHYTKTIAAIIRNSKQLASIACFPCGSHESSFVVWKRSLNTPKPHSTISQKLVKKILVDTAWMHSGQPLKTQEENGLRNKVWKLEGDDANASHVLSERRRREKLNEKFLVLRSLVPSLSKVDKASILGDTIEYLKELQKKVEELESRRELGEFEARGTRKHPDVSERTSDNYGNKEIANGRKPSVNKRKACDMDEAEVEHHWVLLKDGPVDVKVTVIEKEVLIEMHCQWRECLLLEIVDATSNLHLDPFSVQSSTVDDTLAVTIKAKFRGSVVASPGMIKRVLQRVVGKC
ncbi:transcription factor GLABRA 3 [Cocos nucifera]|uniref:Transcription factor GLABRA 3 n=1 Tax=Cocos nucifera TaxID=13894 RepID=A0A8K0IG95_COCNU|nr:transcription factor GLABRA 3 [Cocos nucifera]